MVHVSSAIVCVDLNSIPSRPSFNFPFPKCRDVHRPKRRSNERAGRERNRRSLFIHFYPSDWKRTYDNLDVHYRIPPDWNAVLPPVPGLERLVMAETSALEPDCADTWCALNDTLWWDVRGEFGTTLSGDGVRRDLDFEGKGIRTPRHWGRDEF